MDDQFLRYLKNILFIDIETIAQSPDFESVDERLQQHWERKAGNLKNEDELSAAELYTDRAAIYAEYGKVICIGFGAFYQDENGELRFRAKALTNENEQILLTDFKDILEKHKAKNELLLCAHNGKEFDYPYLCRRMLINGVSLPAVLQLSMKKSWNIQHLDTMEMWKFGDFKSYTSLDLLATIFDIPSSKSEIDGSKVNYTYYVEKDLTKIKRYCASDVVVLAQLFLRLNAYPVIEQEAIMVVE